MSGYPNTHRDKITKTMKLKHFAKGAVRGVKSFVVNKALGFGNSSNLVSSFTSSFNQVKTGNVSGINTMLKKSPFEKTLNSSTASNPKDDPLGFQHLQYPTDLTGAELGNWILFFTIATNLGDNPSYNADLKLAEDMNLNPGKGWHEITDHDMERVRIDSLRDEYKKRGITIPRMNKTNTVLSDDVTKDIVSGAVALYMPNDVKVSYGAEWGAEDTGLSGDLFAAYKDMKQIQYEVTPIKEIAKKVLGHSAGIATGKLGQAISSLTSGLGAGDWLKLGGKAMGIAMNNRKEMFYNGPGWREFNYSFSFWPRNSDEMNRVQKIIQMFKYHMHPWRDDAWGGRIFRYPSEFEIHYLHRTGINDKLHKISRCALTKCDVSYSPQGSAFKTFGDHSPVTYKVDLSFKELEYLTKQKVKDGY